MSEMGALEKRLDRFEFQLDEIRTALVQMAKTEERVAIILDQNNELFKKYADMQNRVSHLERENATQGQSLSFFERAGWIIAGAFASIATWFITK